MVLTMEELKIVTLNCWGVFTPFCCEKRHERIAAIAAQLADEEYDVVCLQEVWTDGDFEKIRRRMAPSYPHSHYFHSNLIGSGCCIFSRHQLVDTFFHRFPLNGFPQRVYHGDWFGGKGIGMARIRMRRFVVNVYVTHMHAQYSGEDAADEYRSHRLAQTYELARLVRLTGAGADAVLVAGDLNCRPDSLGVRAVTALGALRDAWTEQSGGRPEEEFDGATCGRPDNSFTSARDLARHPRGERLDYVLFAPNAGTDLSCVRCELALGRIKDAGFNFSDHEGLAAQFRLKRVVTAEGASPDPEECSRVRRQLAEEMGAGLERVRRDRLFYAGAALLAAAVAWLGAGLGAALVGPAAWYLLFALWTLIVGKAAERRGLQAVRDQLRVEGAAAASGDS